MWMKNIEKLEKLPLRESRKVYLTRKLGNMYNSLRTNHHWDYSEKTDSPWWVAQKTLAHFTDKPFDDAYSYYCKKVKYWERWPFLNILPLSEQRWSGYFIDDEGIIRKKDPNWAHYYKKNGVLCHTTDKNLPEYVEYCKMMRQQRLDEIKKEKILKKQKARYADFVLKYEKKQRKLLSPSD